MRNFKAGKFFPHPLNSSQVGGPAQRTGANHRSPLLPLVHLDGISCNRARCAHSESQCAGQGWEAHLVGTAEAQPQLSQDLQHARAAIALDSIKGSDSRQALQKAEVLPHHGTQVGHEEGSDLFLYKKRGEDETPLSSLLVHATFPPSTPL